MHFRWVKNLRHQDQPQKTQFTSSLRRSVVMILLLTSLFPILTIGAFNYLRSRGLLLDQVRNQIQRIVEYQVDEIAAFVAGQAKAVSKLEQNQMFQEYTQKLLLNQPGSDDYLRSKNFLYYSLRANPLTNPIADFDRVAIIRPDHTVAFASDTNWSIENFRGGVVDSVEIQSLLGQEQTLLTSGAIRSYANRTVLINTRPIEDQQGKLLATLVTFTAADPINRGLASAGTFVPGSRMYYFQESGNLLSVNDLGTSVAALKDTDVGREAQSIINQGKTRLNFTSQSFEDVPVLAYAQWLPDYNIGVVLEVSQPVILRSNNSLDSLSLGLLLACFIVSTGLIYYSSGRWVTPLVQLSQTVNQFSQGRWDERSPIQRTDEIGLLADSFNHMAGELSEMYRSLESVVQRRTSQVRGAAEIAEQVTSLPSITEMFRQTAVHIQEKFGYPRVLIYLMDESGRFLTLKEVSGKDAETVQQRGSRVGVNDSTLTGWAANNNRPKVISNFQKSPTTHSKTLLEDAQSAMAVPFSLGSQVFGVLEIQSLEPGAFDEDTVTVFSTLANQVSSNLHTSRLLESTRVSYQETSLLYRATQQVAQAHSEVEIMQSLADAFTQLPLVASILDVQGENLKILAVTDPETGRIDHNPQALNIAAGRLNTLLVENRVVLIEDLSRSSTYENILSLLRRRGCVSAALISVLENGQLSKVIALGARESGLISHVSLQPYANLAEVIGASLERHEILETLQKRIAELQILTSFSQAISAETDLVSLYQALHKQVTQALGPEIDFMIALYDEPHSQIEFPYVHDSGQLITIDPIPFGEGLTSGIIQERQPLLLPNSQAVQARRGKVIGRDAQSWLGVPLIFGGSIVGAVVVQDLEKENRFGQDDLSLLMTLAPQIATTIRNTQLYTETQQALLAYEQERFLLNTLLDNIPETIAFKDPKGRYIRVSRSFARNYDQDPENITGKTDFDLMHPDAATAVQQQEQAVLNAGQADQDNISKVTVPGAKPVWLHGSRLPIYTQSGGIYGLLHIERDITPLKEAEELAQRRAGEVQTAAEIARDTTGLLDVNLLLQKSINLVRERFGFYHASIFLTDPAGEYAVLRESTGEAGRQMLERRHRLAVGSKSIVGQVTINQKAIIVNDVTSSPTHLPNPLLPDTRSEMAIPLNNAGRVLGALDVQSTQANAFTEEDVQVLQILADQLAVALVNGELFAQTRELLNKHRLLRQITIDASTTLHQEETFEKVVTSLHKDLQAERAAVYLMNSEGWLELQTTAGQKITAPILNRVGEGILGRAAQEKRPIRVDDTRLEPQNLLIDAPLRSMLAIPILFGDELIGVISLESTQPSAFDENDQEILGALGSNLGGVIANIRLVNQVRQQVVRERQLFEVTSRIRESVDLETILRTSTQEICRVLGARKASIQITAGVTPAEPAVMPSANSSLSNGNKRANGTRRSNGTGPLSANGRAKNGPGNNRQDEE